MTSLSGFLRLVGFASGNRKLLGAAALLGLPGLLLLATPPAQAQSYASFGTVAVGSSSTAQTVTVTLATTGTAVNSVAVLTLGAPHMDYTETGTDNCAGISSGSCQVTVTFSPEFPGVRRGAVVLEDAAGNTLGTEYLSGVGEGPLAVMIPGAISTVAGQVNEWTNVNDGSLATEADLYLPSGVAVDGTGDLFIADSHHNRIREVLAAAQGSYSAGDMITVAGDGNAGYESTDTVATTTSLNVPGGVAVDGAGHLYIADTNNNVIREVNLTTGTIATVAGDGTPGYAGDNGAATAAELNSPGGITVDAEGNLYIADTGNNVIREVSGGTITTIAGTGAAGFSGDGGPATSAKLNAPYGVALDASGNLYIPDSANNRVRVVNTSGTISTYAGNGTPAYLGDGGAATSAELYSPLGVACDPAGNVYIADARNYVVRKVDAATGIISTVAGSNADAQYGDGKSNESYGNGQSGEKYSGGGIATSAGIYAPYAVTVDAAGDLLIAEYFDHLIRKVTATNATLFVSPELWQNQVSAPQAQKVENDGNAALTFASVANDVNTAVDAGTSTCSASVAVDGQCMVGAELAPSTQGNPLVGVITLTGNAANSPATIDVVGQALGLNGAAVTLTTTPNPSPYGQAVTLNVNVAQGPSSSKGTPTGTVTFTDTFGGATNALGAPVTLNSSGNASLAVTTLAVGTHVITANYSGDTYYSSASSNPVSQVVQEQVTVTIASSSPNDTSTLGSTVTFTAGVTISGGVPVTGAVSFYDGATYIGSGNLNGSGVATFGTASLPLGSNSITATYTDVNNVSASSPALTQLVKQQTTTTVGSSGNPSIYGKPVTFTAVVVATGSTAPTGTVTFFDAGTQIGTGTLATTGTGMASAAMTTSTLTAGTHTITAAYGGDGNDFSSTSAALTQTVNITSTATGITASVNPVIAGTTLTLTAAVTANGGTPTGTVNFYSGATLLGSSKLGGTGLATYATSTLAVGSYSITATYEGDTNDTGSTSAPLALTVEQATTSVQLTSSNPSVSVTNAVTFSATVKGNGGVPTGSVTFMDGTNTLGSIALNGSGVASYTTSSLAVGTHTISAVYAGDADDAGGRSATLTETVSAYATQTQLAASTTNLTTDQQITLLTTTTAANGGPVSGTLTFMNGSANLGTTQVGSGGSGTLTLSLQPGSYSITAQYGGDAEQAPSTSNAVTVTVTQATEFTIELNPTSVTIPSSQYATVSIQMASQNSFADKMALGCDSLPYSVTCNFASNDVTLNANGTATVQLTVDTNSPLASGGQAKNEMPGGNGLLAAGLFPFLGLAFWRFRKRTAVLRMLTLIAMLAGTTFLMMGCGGFSLNSAQAGSYVIQVTATGEQTGVTHVANLTVQVTK